MHRKFPALASALALAACAGGQSQLPAPQAGWSALLRYQPTVLALSLHAPGMQFAYVDASPANGVFPSAQTFWSEFESANPNVDAGACAGIATLSHALISPSTVSGAQSPTVVISAYPKAAGSCTETVDVGANGQATFAVTVTP